MVIEVRHTTSQHTTNSFPREPRFMCQGTWLVMATNTGKWIRLEEALFDVHTGKALSR